MNRKKIKLFFIFLFIIALGVAVSWSGFLLWKKVISDVEVEVRTNMFGGQIEKIEGDVVYLRGVYYFRDGAHPQGPAGDSNQASVRIQTSSRTRYKKIILQAPKPEQRNSDGTFNTANLDRQDVDGSFEEMSKWKDIMVTAEGNVYGSMNFEASLIEYVSFEGFVTTDKSKWVIPTPTPSKN